jgi:hypothetical protein
MNKQAMAEAQTAFLRWKREASGFQGRQAEVKALLQRVRQLIAAC